MVGDEGQCAVDAFRLKEVDHALPDEQCLAPLVIAAAVQDLAELLGIEISRDEGNVSRQRINDLLQALQLDRLGRELVDLEYSRLLDSRDAEGARVETSAENDDLLEARAQAGLEVVVDVALAPNDERDRPGSHTLV